MRSIKARIDVVAADIDELRVDLPDLVAAAVAKTLKQGNG